MNQPPARSEQLTPGRARCSPGRPTMAAPSARGRCLEFRRSPLTVAPTTCSGRDRLTCRRSSQLRKRRGRACPKEGAMLPSPSDWEADRGAGDPGVSDTVVWSMRAGGDRSRTCERAGGARAGGRERPAPATMLDAGGSDALTSMKVAAARTSVPGSVTGAGSQHRRGPRPAAVAGDRHGVDGPCRPATSASARTGFDPWRGRCASSRPGSMARRGRVAPESLFVHADRGCSGWHFGSC
jgi:hypothetical protein